MHFELTAEQRDWQMKARRFAQEEIRPISLARDQMQDAAATWDWDIIRKGSKLGFRTAAVPRQLGGHGIDFDENRRDTGDAGNLTAAVSDSTSADNSGAACAPTSRCPAPAC